MFSIRLYIRWFISHTHILVYNNIYSTLRLFLVITLTFCTQFKVTKKQVLLVIFEFFFMNRNINDKF